VKLLICRHASPPKNNAMMIVQSLLDRIEELFDVTRLPSVDCLRPTTCPCCGKPAFSLGERLGIVGHGTYRRQVLGLVEASGDGTILVRRYLCQGCKRTMSILSAGLHPSRWYAGGVILEALRLHLLEGQSEREVREHFGIGVDSESWRSLRRWRSQLLVTLWAWLRGRLGARGKATSREDGRHRLRQLLSEAGPDKHFGDAFTAARRLLTGTVHSQGLSWPLGHDPPGQLRTESPL
jgi:hypothetical protein